MPAATRPLPFAAVAAVALALAAPSAAAQAPQPGKPVPQPVKAAPQPGKPVPQPVKAAPQPGKPVPQPVKAAPQPGKPVPQPVKAAPARPAPDTPCTRTAAWLDGLSRFNPRQATARLRRLEVADPACLLAPEAAFRLWRKLAPSLMPAASGRVTRAVAMRTWSRYEANVAFLEAIMGFRRAPNRANVALDLARLHEAMGTYLDQVGTGPEALLTVREAPESLYHSRAVDLREHLKLKAEAAYEDTLRLLARAAPDHPTAVDARARLLDLRERYRERAEEERAAAERARERLERQALERGELPPVGLP